MLFSLSVLNCTVIGFKNCTIAFVAVIAIFCILLIVFWRWKQLWSSWRLGLVMVWGLVQVIYSASFFLLLFRRVVLVQAFLYAYSVYQSEKEFLVHGCFPVKLQIQWMHIPVFCQVSAFQPFVLASGNLIVFHHLQPLFYYFVH